MSVGENGEIVHKTDELARQFHERYEEIAPLYGYKTRADTKVFDPESPNGRLMRAVCLQVVGPIIAERDEAREAIRSFVDKMRDQAAVFKREDLRDNSRWSIFNEGRAQALEKFAEELEASK